MEHDYFEAEDPPSCAVTCTVITLVGFTIAIPLMIPILFGDESTFFLYTVIASAIIMVILFPASWWAAKRTKKWARLSVERKTKTPEEKV